MCGVCTIHELQFLNFLNFFGRLVKILSVQVQIVNVNKYLLSFFSKFKNKKGFLWLDWLLMSGRFHSIHCSMTCRRREVSSLTISEMKTTPFSLRLHRRCVKNYRPQRRTFRAVGADKISHRDRESASQAKTSVKTNDGWTEGLP